MMRANDPEPTERPGSTAGRETPGESASLDLRYKLHMAVSMIRANPRNARTFTSVSVATFGLLLSFAAITAMGTMMTQSASDIVSGDVSAFADGYEYSMLNPESDVVTYIADAESTLERVAGAEGVEQVRPRLTAGASMTVKAQDAGVVLVGSDIAAEGYEIVAGQAPAGAAQVCINIAQRDELGIDVGTSVRLSVAGAPVDAGPITADVVCVYDNSRFGLFRSSSVVMDIAGMQQILDRPDAITQILITLAPGIDPATAAASLGADAPGLQFLTSKETAGLIFTVLAAQQAIMWALVIVAALICAVLIGNVVGFSLRRDRRELATMRTMGFSAKDIETVYAVQVLLIGLGMVLIGTVAAIIAVVIAGAVGIPIGDGQQLFGGDTLRPSLKASDVLLTGGLMIAAQQAANALAARKLLSRSPVQMAESA
ncbi:ABC transporter permease [Pseudoclavibacter sp. VKM Ac-2867]|uniref:ABC transporter permease n=1 Tax=Pseudoclavibacter sp. VKM Ac-2867 TaxID=2783829 RepID=UPI00188BC760|nr:FtsX-like permease family protein [Pseudoclavibacter sp. VKM Ac-2867]MBF4457709.1 FtsX-like permease family protein [Pseudoclavibacter sp. VKM Ac-2867]